MSSGLAWSFDSRVSGLKGMLGFWPRESPAPVEHGVIINGDDNTVEIDALQNCMP